MRFRGAPSTGGRWGPEEPWPLEGKWDMNSAIDDRLRATFRRRMSLATSAPHPTLFRGIRSHHVRDGRLRVLPDRVVPANWSFRHGDDRAHDRDSRRRPVFR